MSWKNELKRLQDKPKFKRMIGVAEIFTRLSQERFGVAPIIVGGMAVEVYTRGEYVTADIDMVYVDHGLADQILNDMGFIREGRYWYHSGLEVAVEIPSDILAGDIDKVNTLYTSRNRRSFVRVIGLEDLLIDRLNAYKHWNSVADGEWAERLYAIHKDRLDIPYLKKCAQRERVAEEVEQLIHHGLLF